MFRTALFLLLATLCFNSAGAEEQQTRFDRLYAFGDSYSDSGAGYVDGGGPTAVVYMARALGIPFTWAGAADSKGKGLNFAVSAARTGSGSGPKGLLRCAALRGSRGYCWAWECAIR